MYMCIYKYFGQITAIIGYYNILKFPVVYSKSLLLTYFMHDSLYLLMLYS